MASIGNEIGSLFGGGPNNAQFQAAPIQQQQFAPAIAQASGQFNQNFSNQNDLGQALLRQTQGYGPNPAQNQLNQATGVNTANTAALLAGQRGAASNPALAARSAALSGAQNQQQAAGQAATMGAQQQIAATGQLQNLYGMQGQEALGMTGQLQQAQAAQNNAINSASGINAGMANTNAKNSSNTIGGIAQGLGSVTGLLAEGGQVNPNPKIGAVATQDRFPRNLMPDHIKHVSVIYHEHENSPKYSKGGEVPIVVSPGEKIISPGDAVQVAKNQINPMEVGGMVPGKAEVKGDSYKNDTVPKKVPVHSVVIPRTVAQSKDPEKERDFVAKELSKHGKQDDFKAAISRGAKNRKTNGR